MNFSWINKLYKFLKLKTINMSNKKFISSAYLILRAKLNDHFPNL